MIRTILQYNAASTHVYDKQFCLLAGKDGEVTRTRLYHGQREHGTITIDTPARFILMAAVTKFKLEFYYDN